MGHDTTGGGSIRFSMAPERHADAPRWGPSKIMTYKEAYDRMILDLLDDMSRRIDRALRI